MFITDFLFASQVELSQKITKGYKESKRCCLVGFMLGILQTR